MAPDFQAFGTPEFWSRAWAHDRNASLHVKRKIRSEEESMMFWNRVAPSYGKQPSEKSRERVKKVIIYIFNLLYSMGCRPTMQYMDSEWVREESIDAAIERFMRSFWLYTEITSEIKQIITEFVHERSVKGVFREEIKRHLGVIIWKVNHKEKN